MLVKSNENKIIIIIIIIIIITNRIQTAGRRESCIELIFAADWVRYRPKFFWNKLKTVQSWIKQTSLTKFVL